MRRRGTDDYLGPIIQELTEEERLQNKSTASGTSLLEDDEDNQPEVDDGIPFTTKMRQATRSVHGLSDALVNAKLGLAMSDDKVWAEGLLIFYEIFKYLDSSLDRLSPKSPHFKNMASVILPLQRTTSFQTDLAFYYGPTYLQNYSPRASVASYLKHLQILEEREPLRLLAYIYHLYMGLLSGGQILKKKRAFRKKIKNSFSSLFSWLLGGGSSSSSSTSTAASQNFGGGPPPGNAVTTFNLEENQNIGDLKKLIQWTMNDIAGDLSKDERESLISESISVFQRNNEVVGSIQRTGLVALRNLTGNPVIWLVCLVTVGAIIVWWWTAGGPSLPRPGDEVPVMPGGIEVEREAPSGGERFGGFVNMDDLEEPPGADGFLQ